MTLSCLPQRIFILTRFEKWLGRAIATAVSGLVFSLAYLRRRSALEPVTVHAFSDVFAMLSARMCAGYSIGMLRDARLTSVRSALTRRASRGNRRPHDRRALRAIAGAGRAFRRLRRSTIATRARSASFTVRESGNSALLRQVDESFPRIPLESEAHSNAGERLGPT